MYINHLTRKYGSKLVKFDLKIMKEIPKNIENDPQIKPIFAYLNKGLLKLC